MKVLSLFRNSNINTESCLMLLIHQVKKEIFRSSQAFEDSEKKPFKCNRCRHIYTLYCVSKKFVSCILKYRQFKIFNSCIFMFFFLMDDFFFNFTRNFFGFNKTKYCSFLLQKTQCLLKHNCRKFN